MRRYKVVHHLALREIDEPIGADLEEMSLSKGDVIGCITLREREHEWVVSVVIEHTGGKTDDRELPRPSVIEARWSTCTGMAERC